MSVGVRGFPARGYFIPDAMGQGPGGWGKNVPSSHDWVGMRWVGVLQVGMRRVGVAGTS